MSQNLVIGGPYEKPKTPFEVGKLYTRTWRAPFTNGLTDIAAVAALAARLSTPDRKPVVVVDNTLMGPLWQQPLKHGADVVVYSATKFIGGHSDVIAGAALGSAAAMAPARSPLDRRRRAISIQAALSPGAAATAASNAAAAPATSPSRTSAWPRMRAA